MIQHDQSFTDCHGVTHAAAVFVINSANSASTENIYKQYDAENDQYHTNAEVRYNVNYTVHYWTSMQAKNDDMKPIVFCGPADVTSFRFSRDNNEGDLIAACEANFIEEFLTDAAE